MTAPSMKSRFELTVDLVRAIAWPLVALLVLISFWAPFQRTADLIPLVLGRSDTITIAGLSLKVSPGLRNRASPDVQRILAKLTKAGIERILAQGESTWWGRSDLEFAKKENKELLEVGLVSEVPRGEVERRNREDRTDHGYAVQITDLGKRTQAFLRSVVAEFIQQLPVMETN